MRKNHMVGVLFVVALVIAPCAISAEPLRSSEELTALEILEKINLFYDSAWNKLLNTLYVFGSLVGIVIPIGIAYFGSKNLNAKMAVQMKTTDKTQEKLDKLQNDFVFYGLPNSKIGRAIGCSGELDGNTLVLDAIVLAFKNHRVIKISKKLLSQLESNEDVGEDEEEEAFTSEEERIAYVCKKFGCTSKIDGDDVVFTLKRH